MTVGGGCQNKEDGEIRIKSIKNEGWKNLENRNGKFENCFNIN